MNMAFLTSKEQITLTGYGIIELTETKNHTAKKGVILIPMMPYKQLSLADIFSDCQEKF